MLAVTLASIRGLEPTYEPPLTDKTHFLLQVATLGPDGHVAELNGRHLENAFQRMTEPAVLDAALADAWLSSLPQLKKAADPRVELRRMIHLRSVQSTAGPGVIALSVASPIQPIRAARVVAYAIAFAGPPRTSVVPRVYRWGPLDRPWNLAAACVFGLLATLFTLICPLWQRRPESSADRAPGRRPTSNENRANRTPDAARSAIRAE